MKIKFRRIAWFYVQTDTLLLANVLENFTNTCLKIYELDLVKFLSAPGLATVAAIKKSKKRFKKLCY